MRLRKKTAMILSFAVGTLMFSTTALAEVASKTGYDQLKDSVKYTAEACAEKLSGYTADISYIIKDNGTIVYSESSRNKYDVVNKAMENVNISTRGKVKRENYYYADKNGTINKDSSQNIYYESQYEKAQDLKAFTNPFKEKEASDVEKIADALVGNLKDAVVVTQNSDGTKTLSGSLNESQIPALVNAVVSLQSKSSLNNNSEDNYMPKLTKDIYVKEITGKMDVDKDGIIKSVLGTGIISGKDDSGKEHNLSIEILFKLSDINKTTVSRPDLAGKTVQKYVQKDYSKLSNPNLYLGTYKTNIIIEKDGKFTKIGERFVEITSISDKEVSGTYREVLSKGYENYGSKQFNFKGTFSKDNPNAEITADSATGTIKGNISIDQMSANIYFNLNDTRRGSVMWDDKFSRVFD